MDNLPYLDMDEYMNSRIEISGSSGDERAGPGPSSEEPVPPGFVIFTDGQDTKRIRLTPRGSIQQSAVASIFGLEVNFSRFSLLYTFVYNLCKLCVTILKGLCVPWTRCIGSIVFPTLKIVNATCLI